jgi:two-component system, chemotaxis family, protein-glutamate methylesterase/glutaminase
MIRVLIADDSPTARQLIRAILESDPELRVAGEARDGAEAVRMAEELAPDIVLMDVNMPVLDGLGATKEIMMRSPRPILVVSTVSSEREKDLSLSATQAGALLALAKPEGPGSARFREQSEQLVSMVRAMSTVKVVRHWRAAEPASGVQRPLRPPSGKVRMIAVAASTGGPAALRRILMDLPRDLPVPVLVVQHIAHDFTETFAEWLRGSSALHVKVAEHAEAAQPGTVYVAPDDRHLGLLRDGRLSVSREPPVGGFRPSATHLFESAGRVLRGDLIAVVLTGMGSDGADGLVTARRNGAYVVAQDEASSIVFGMAKEAIARGVVDAVLSLEQIAPSLCELVTAEAR